jgi:hypothetical protein
MTYHLVNQFKEENREAFERTLKQGLNQWRSQIVSASLSSEEHLSARVIEQRHQDGLGIFHPPYCFLGEIWVSDEALAKIKQ